MSPTFADLAIPALSDVLPQIERLVAARTPIVLVSAPSPVTTMIARRIPSLLPTPSALESAWIRAEWSAVYGGPEYGHTTWPRYADRIERPFRAPHYTVSQAGLLGSTVTQHAVPCRVLGPRGGRCDCRKERVFRSGELQLARHGVLFLDEIAEFSRAALQGLACEWRAMAGGRPVLVASSLPCPCGFRGRRRGPTCSCSPEAIERYTGWNGRLAQAVQIFGGAVVEIPTLDASDLRAMMVGP